MFHDSNLANAKLVKFSLKAEKLQNFFVMYRYHKTAKKMNVGFRILVENIPIETHFEEKSTTKTLKGINFRVWKSGRHVDITE